MSLSKVPLSPHLQVYRLPLVALVSISHRACGVVNGLGYALFIIFLISIATGYETYKISYIILTSTIGKILVSLWIFSLYLHMSNGVRHLFWDFGYGFSGNSPLISSFIVLASSIILTGVTVLLYLF
ncbi:MAG: succinate dehydrogenase, cytochrome b556 subunit [Gammaproteobacteria bacterium]|jgi:succinate dehydrogenase / fumarate reductase, cytochrome b subunit|nr:succinate dehydrogenase, cytochrome b556 subunit [Gammaproteobacteria bacterium]|tara:strand:+ start:72 stop:452 length:381 start_codon:yes stop_codon:yes gene_type:complete